MTRSKRLLTALLGLAAIVQTGLAQRFTFFAPEVRTSCPSVVYDFLETYLYEIDSLQRKGKPTEGRLRDDKVLFLAGSASSARLLTADMPFHISRTDGKYYEVAWSDTLGRVVLHLAFPMQYELLLGKPRTELEQAFKATLEAERPYMPHPVPATELSRQEDGCLMTTPVSHYYVESLNTASYYRQTASGDTVPAFANADKWHAAANLFRGCIDDVSGYTLYVEQNLYGFKKVQYTVSLQQWLAYCRDMKFNVYFGIEEEREDGLAALLIAQSTDLGFNHMLSLIIPDNFVTNGKTVFKATLNTYIPTHNLKDLYQQYVEKPKKKI